jgi:hypothetical protein
MCQIVLKKDYRCRIHLFALYRMKKPNGLLIEQNVRTRLEPNSVMVFLVWCLLTVGMAASRLRQLPYFAVPWTMAFAGSAQEQFCCFPILSLWEFYPEVLQRSLLRQ